MSNIINEITKDAIAAERDHFDGSSLLRHLHDKGYELGVNWSHGGHGAETDIEYITAGSVLSKEVFAAAINDGLRAHYHVDELVSALKAAIRGYEWVMRSGVVPSTIVEAMGRRKADLTEVLTGLERK